jgi:hypothetical protein
MPARDKCSSSLQKIITYSRKRFYRTGPGSICLTSPEFKLIFVHSMEGLLRFGGPTYFTFSISGIWTLGEKLFHFDVMTFHDSFHGEVNFVQMYGARMTIDCINKQHAEKMLIFNLINVLLIHLICCFSFRNLDHRRNIFPF